MWRLHPPLDVDYSLEFRVNFIKANQQKVCTIKHLTVHRETLNQDQDGCVVQAKHNCLSYLF